jgi:TetR/AcrR family transcriptional repressor of nem operon
MKDFNITAHKILDVAEDFTRRLGFNGFSYRDLQKVLGIRTSSIHYYFPAREDLARALVSRYLERYKNTLAEIEVHYSDAESRLRALGKLFLQGVEEEKFCLCGMLAADLLSLPKEVEFSLREFFNLNQEWIKQNIKDGIKEKIFRNSVNPEEAAAYLLAALEGGMLIALTCKRREYLAVIIESALSQLKE